MFYRIFIIFASIPYELATLIFSLNISSPITSTHSFLGLHFSRFFSSPIFITLWTISSFFFYIYIKYIFIRILFLKQIDSRKVLFFSKIKLTNFTEYMVCNLVCIHYNITINLANKFITC